MIVGSQIKQARILLRWGAKQLAQSAHVRTETVERAERSTGELPITIANAEAIRHALERAGIEFTPEVRLTRPAETKEG